jgi:general nucleoside transport system permease protein
MWSEFFQAVVIINLFAATLRMSTPLLISALGELVAEKSGILNLGIEGMMLFGTFFVWLVAFNGGTTMMAIGVVILIGALLGCLIGWMMIYLHVNQTVTGLSLNLLASGLTVYVYRALGAGNQTISVKLLPNFSIPFLSNIPYIGEIFFDQSVFTYLVFLSVPIIAWGLKHTKLGLAIRSAGENPGAVETRGINVYRIRLLSIIFGCIMACLGGAFLMTVMSSRFLPEMVAGRGWLALIIVIAGNWNPVRMVAATLIFAFLGALQVTLTAFNIAVPYEFMLILPYVLGLIVLMITRTRSASPAKLAVPYIRD